VLCVADNNGNIVAPLTVRPVNVHDSKLFYESFSNLMEFAFLLEYESSGSLPHS
jgi:hypothetical protein